MKHDTTFDKIDAWLSGELDEAEARAFEAEMAANTDLAAAVRQRRIARLAIDRLVEQDFERRIAKWRTEMHDLPEPPLPWWRRRFAWAVLLLLPLAGAFWFYMPAKSAPESSPAEQQESQPVFRGDQEDDQPPPVIEAPGDPVPPARPTIAQTRPLTKQQREALAAVAHTNLRGYPGTVRAQYGRTMGAQSPETVFTAGKDAFQQATDPQSNLSQAERTEYRQTAKRQLLNIPPADEYHTAAQEMLAWLFFLEENYAEAARRYDRYAAGNNVAATDWWRLQFYLADYPNRKADFQTLLEEVLNPAKPHQYANRVAELKAAVEAWDK